MYGNALTTKERMKERLGIAVTTFDNLLTNIILGVTARIEQMTGRRYVQATYTNELHDGSNMEGVRRKYLIVKNAPIQALTAISYQAGTNTTPNWRAFTADDYHADLEAGVLYFPSGLPPGFRNIRLTYTGGFSGTSIGVNNFWVFNITPTGTVNGVNRTFTLPVAAAQVVVYADGVREAAANVTFTAGGTSFTLAAGRAPFSTIAVDYQQAVPTGTSDVFLPADLVEVCEEAVTRIFKRRDSEGRASESFQESSITWNKSVFSDEDLRTIRNYRRGYEI